MSGEKPATGTNQRVLDYLSPDADFVGVHNSKPPGYIDVLEKEHSAANGLPDPFLGSRMNLQSDDAERFFGRESYYVREIRVQRYEHAAAVDREAQNLFIVGARKPNLRNPCRVVPLGLSSAACWRERFSSSRNFTGSRGRPHRRQGGPHTRGSP